MKSQTHDLSRSGEAVHDRDAARVGERLEAAGERLGVTALERRRAGTAAGWRDWQLSLH